MIRRTLPSLREAIESALPERLLTDERAELAAWLDVAIIRWQREESLFGPEKAKRRALVRNVNRFKAALNKVNAQLTNVATKEQQWLEANHIRLTSTGASAVLDLHNVATVALAGLTEWEQRYRPKKSDPLKTAARLTEQLQRLCGGDRFSLSSYEFQEVITAINHTGRLPVLSIDTLKKRRKRGTGKRKNST